MLMIRVVGSLSARRIFHKQISLKFPEKRCFLFFLCACVINLLQWTWSHRDHSVVERCHGLSQSVCSSVLHVGKKFPQPRRHHSGKLTEHYSILNGHFYVILCSKRLLYRTVNNSTITSFDHTIPLDKTGQKNMQNMTCFVIPFKWMYCQKAIISLRNFILKLDFKPTQYESRVSLKVVLPSSMVRTIFYAYQTKDQMCLTGAL